MIPFTLELDTAHHEQHHEFYRLSTHFVFHGKAISQVSYLPVSKWANNELVRDSDEEIAGKLKSRHFIETHLLNLQAKILKG